ncbi:MAG: hypothetical protein H6509_12795 [Bryobacterales bacterium]|nr:hypothetical protein [Bryobacterales bacterium]
MFAIVLVFLLGVAGLAIDGSRLYAEHARVQGAADAAAIGAVQELRRGHRDYERDLAPAAMHDAALWGFDAGNAEIIVHHPPVTGEHQGSADHVEVVVRTQMQNSFMAMFGATSQAVSGRAVGGLAAGDSPCIAAFAEDGYTVEGAQPFEPECAVAPSAAVNPFAALRMPPCAGAPVGASEPAEGSGETLYWPGCHEEMVTIRSGKARLMPGTHIFAAGLTISGGEVEGDGVSLFFPAADSQTGVTLQPQAQVNLRAPSRGEMAGVLMFGEAGDAVLERGAGSQLEGALYFPKSTLRWAPNAPGSQAWTQAAAERIVVLEAPDGRSVTAAPSAVTPSMTAVLAE